LGAAFLATTFLAATFLGAAFVGAGGFFLPREKVISILKAATGATRRAAATSFMVWFSFFRCYGDVIFQVDRGVYFAQRR